MIFSAPPEKNQGRPEKKGRSRFRNRGGTACPVKLHNGSIPGLIPVKSVGPLYVPLTVALFAVIIPPEAVTSPVSTICSPGSEAHLTVLLAK